jgi:hypothetical protein
MINSSGAGFLRHFLNGIFKIAFEEGNRVQNIEVKAPPKELKIHLKELLDKCFIFPSTMRSTCVVKNLNRSYW